ncbi:hypothetical protein OZD61_02705 [Wolbachia endosymbiont of Drosophila bocki]|uniref:hypothetical protein n=1 Tax=Wolbachia endosymbiont of Drosophila bocki TaxID=3002576 RepID=UPI0023AA0F1A|nr:hypothetical protein [Wolbachia endosymbiont of Drosophila bocki]MDE5057697.1 hypothetical protein [Wolbachia endosymbiont of Drosophila bocki]
MISLFYKLRLLNYILGSLKDIIVKLFLFTMYLYTFGIVLMFLSNGFWYAVEFCSFKNAFYRLFQYCRWYYENREDLGYGISIRILVAFLTPHFLYKLLLGTGWKSFLKEKIIQILNTRRKKGSEFSNSSKPSGSSYSDKNNYSNNSGNNERQAQDAKRKVNMIKQLLIKDIEATIDRRLNYIFFGKRSKPH